MWFECVTTKNLSQVDGVVWEVPEMLQTCRLLIDLMIRVVVTR